MCLIQPAVPPVTLITALLCKADRAILLITGLYAKIATVGNVTWAGGAYQHTGITSGCAECHLDYSTPPRSSSLIDHTAFTTFESICEECHSGFTAWTGGDYEHSGGSGICHTCHLGYSTPQRTTPHSGIQFAGAGDSDCELCHTTSGGWSFVHVPDTTGCAACHFDYSTPAKPQSHTTNNWTVCEECHVGNVTWAGGGYQHTGITSGCADCHLEYSTPPRSASLIDAFTTLESICEECHSGFTAWTGGSYNHSGGIGICHTCHLGYSTPVRSTPHTGVQFVGAGDSDCELCHTTNGGWSFVHVPDTTGCAACHLDYSTPAKPATHATNNWTVCEECHVGNVTWAGGGYQHTGITSGCADCHLEYSTPPRSASLIDHTAFTTLESICEECHSGFVAWTGGNYNHSGGTGICHTCHIGYSTPVRSTPHTGVQFAGAGDSDCELCHTTNGGWSFVHVPDTTGCAACHFDYSTPAKPQSHTTNNWTVCEECHVGNVTWAGGGYQHTGITSGCADCHLEYSTPPRSSSLIDHSAFTTLESICEECHSGFTAWTGGSYNHSGGIGICHTCHLGYSTPQRTTPHTGVQFVGAGDSDCELCHTTSGGWAFQHVPDTTGCAACHFDYSTPVKPTDHTTNNWTVCEDCHSGNVTWAGGAYQHTGITSGCAECHLDYSTPPRSSSLIDHTAFTTLESICEECHSGFVAWTGGNYNHSGGTGICHTCHIGYSTPVRSTPHNGIQFAGAGDSDCELCHTTGGGWSFVHVPDTSGCAACHLNYSTPAKPQGHITNNWTVCEDCHSGNVTWSGGGYQHTGVTSGCADCHLDYSTPPRTTNHSLSRFGGMGDTTCEECHTTTGNWIFVHTPTISVAQHVILATANRQNRRIITPMAGPSVSFAITLHQAGLAPLTSIITQAARPAHRVI